MEEFGIKYNINYNYYNRLILLFIYNLYFYIINILEF